MAKQITIIVNKKPYHVTQEEMGPADFQALIGAPNDYEVWQVVHDADPEGQPPKDDIQVTGPVKIKNGEKFRVVPPGTFGAF